ncbi:hypothetical protein [Cyclobacterium xiamenense]|uniref:hypothetical protein n=1 Tax=Cyclobacterium xiamenense TaxID=1297121 RepID=UPI0035D0E117
MKVRPFPLFVLFFVLQFSCTAEKDENVILKEQVIAIHDEVMPEIGTLRSRQKKLEEKADSLMQEAGTQESDGQVQELLAAAQSCEAAYDGMFVWMRQFESEYEDMTEEEVRMYLEDQMQKVERVKQDIQSALTRSDALLNANP